MMNDAAGAGNRGGPAWRAPAGWLATLLFLTTLALYWPTLHFDFINCDDPDYVTANSHVLTGLSPSNLVWAFTTGHAGNWHPLTWISLMTDATLVGAAPGGMHFVNALLHALNGVLLFYLLKSLTGATWRSAWVAAIFAWHPIHVESVAWIAERKDVLSTFFGLLSLMFYASYAASAKHKEELVAGPPAGRPSSSIFNLESSFSYSLSWLCFALGLLSKPMLVTWPLVLWLLDYWPLGRWNRRRLWRLVVEKIPFLALSVAASAATLIAQHHGGAVASIGHLPPEARAANAVVSYCRYLGKLLWPTNLAIFYPHPVHTPASETVGAGLFLGAITCLVFARARRFPFLLTGWCWYLITLIPVIGLVQVGRQSMADRYAYIPSIGILVMLAWGGFECRKHRPSLDRFFSAAALASGLACLMVARRQIAYWHDSGTLYRHALAVTRDNFFVHDSLGVHLASQGFFSEAIGEYQEAARLQPETASVREHLGAALAQTGQTDAAIEQFQIALRLNPGDSEAHNDLGAVFEAMGRTDEATKQFQEAIRLQPNNADAHYNMSGVLNKSRHTDQAVQELQTAISIQPDYADAHYNLGYIRLDQGNTAAALAEFQSAFRFKPYTAKVHYDLGNQLAKRGLAAAAIDEFQAAIRLNPADADARNNLGNLLAQQGNLPAALSQYQAALKTHPDDADAHYNLANALVKLGQFAAAIPEFQAAIRLRPNYAPAHYNLGAALEKQGQINAAAVEFHEAIRLQPDYPIAHNRLGIALAAQGQMDAAIHEFQEAIRLKPDYAAAKTNLLKAEALKKQ